MVAVREKKRGARSLSSPLVNFTARSCRNLLLEDELAGQLQLAGSVETVRRIRSGRRVEGRVRSQATVGTRADACGARSRSHRRVIEGGAVHRGDVGVVEDVEGFSQELQVELLAEG